MKKIWVSLFFFCMACTMYGQPLSKKIHDVLLPSGESIDIYINNTWKKSEKFGTFTDLRDGKVYKTVRIGHQVWQKT
jgi:hypothetical protein